MISIVICSRRKFISEELDQNINDTIGSLYELIVIDNSENQYSIFEAYNVGIEKSKGKYLCFLHDDLFIHTQGWGNVISRLFDDNQDYGLIGIAGASIKTKMPSGWWDCEEKYKSLNIIQHLPNNEKERQNIGFENCSFNEVVVVDGVFLAVRKYEGLSFDEELKGFHNYDLNISLETIKKGYKIGVTNEILLEHFSIGNLNKEWLKSTIDIHNKYNALLPIHSGKEHLIESEIFTGKRFIDHCVRIVGRKRMYKNRLVLSNLNLFSETRLSLFKYLTKRIFEK